MIDHDGTNEMTKTTLLSLHDTVPGLHAISKVGRAVFLSIFLDYIPFLLRSGDTNISLSFRLLSEISTYSTKLSVRYILHHPNVYITQDHS